MQTPDPLRQQHVSSFGKPIAVSNRCYTRYYAQSGMTIAWVQDGEAQVKIYVDRLNPVGCAVVAPGRSSI